MTCPLATLLEGASLAFDIHYIRGTRAVETQFQTGNPDPYPLHQRRTDVGQT